MEGNERLEKGMGARLASVAALVCLLIALTSCAPGESSAAESDGSGDAAIEAEATEVLGASTIDESRGAHVISPWGPRVFRVGQT